MAAWGDGRPTATRARLGVALVVTMVLAACGSRVPLEMAQGDLAPAEALEAQAASAGRPLSATTTVPAGGLAGGAGGAATLDAGETGPAGGGVAAAPTTTAPAVPRTTVPKPPLNIKITFATRCVVAGTAQTMNINLGEPGALLYWVMYDKNRFGPSQAHHAPAGTWQVQWTVPPDIPPGPAEAHVSAASYSGKRGEAVGTFTVAGLGGTC